MYEARDTILGRHHKDLSQGSIVFSPASINKLMFPSIIAARNKLPDIIDL